MTAAPPDVFLDRALGVSAALHAGLLLFGLISLRSGAESRPALLPPIRAHVVRLGSPAPRPAPPESAAPPKGVSVQQKAPEPPAPKKENKKPSKPEPVRAKQPPKPAPPPPAGGAAAGVPGNLPPGAAGGVSGLEGGDFAHVWYLESIQRKIADSWVKPSTAGVPADAVVYFRIQSDGRVTDVEIRQSSGSPLYDRAALRAVMSASPMPPLPKGSARDYLGVHFSFLREAAQ